MGTRPYLNVQKKFMYMTFLISYECPTMIQSTFSAQAFLRPSQTFIVELFTEIPNVFQLLSVFEESSITDF